MVNKPQASGFGNGHSDEAKNILVPFSSPKPEPTIWSSNSILNYAFYLEQPWPPFLFFSIFVIFTNQQMHVDKFKPENSSVMRIVSGLFGIRT